MNKRLLVVCLFLFVSYAFAQSCVPGNGVTCTANLNLWIPPLNYQNWYIPLNSNFNTIDSAAANWVKLTTPNTFTGSPQTSPIFNATTQFNVNGVQIASSNLSDGVNLPKLTAPNTFIGSPQTAPIFNATTQFNVNGVQIASSNLSDGVNLPKLNIGNNYTAAINTFLTVNATVGYTVNGSGGTAGNCLASNGTVYNTPSLCGLTIQLAGTALPQEPALNFVSGATVVDDPTNHRTNVTVASVVPKVQLSLSATTVNANTCSLPATASLTGVTSTSTFSTAFATNPTAAVGWGANGGLVVELWPDASPDILDWAICNQTTSNITPTAITLNVGVN